MSFKNLICNYLSNYIGYRNETSLLVSNIKFIHPNFNAIFTGMWISLMMSQVFYTRTCESRMGSTMEWRFSSPQIRKLCLSKCVLITENKIFLKLFFFKLFLNRDTELLALLIVFKARTRCSLKGVIRKRFLARHQTVVGGISRFDLIDIMVPYKNDSRISSTISSDTDRRSDSFFPVQTTLRFVPCPNQHCSWCIYSGFSQKCMRHSSIQQC